MRVTSLLVLAAIVAAGVGIFGFNAYGLRDKIFSAAEKGKESIQGYTAAKTPGEAMEMFRKAIKDRAYRTAAKYVTGNYAEQLTQAHDAAVELGGVIDDLQTYMKNAGFTSDKTTFFLNMLDPFPGNFRVADTPKQDGDKAKGMFLFDRIALTNPSADFSSDARSMDGLMFSNNLHPYAIAAKWDFAVDIVAEPQGDSKVWKLAIAVTAPKVQAIGYLKDHYKSYVTGMQKFRTEATNQRYGSKGEFERELIKVLQDSK